MYMYITDITVTLNDAALYKEINQEQMEGEKVKKRLSFF